MNRFGKTVLLLIIWATANSAVLFEVKDNAGKNIMEVSDDGVRFFNPQYIPMQNEKDTLMVISATNIKAIVRKAGGGSASRDFDIADIGSIRKGAGKSVMKMSVADGYGVGGDSAVVFYKPKNAFRTNSILQDVNLVGQTSFASGYQSQASGDISTAIGYKTKATNLYATSTGCQTEASGISSISTGHSSKSTADYSFSAGNGSLSAGTAAVAMGDHPSATGINSIALGTYTKAEGYGSIAIGNHTNALGIQSSAFGSGTTASGITSTAFGDNSLASGDYAFAACINNQATANSATAFGSSTKATGVHSFSMGDLTIASGRNAVSFGVSTIASGDNSIAGGFSSKTFGNSAIALGNNTNATGHNSTALGEYSYAQSYDVLSAGRFNKQEGSSTSWIATDPLFVLGNGTNINSLSNAFEVKKNGDTYIPSLYTTTSTNAKKTVLVDDQGKLCVMSAKDDSGEINNLKKENSDLKTRVAKLEALMEQMLNK